MQVSDKPNKGAKCSTGATIAVTCVLGLLALTGCAGKNSSFDRDYRLRLWETCRIQADHAFRKRQWDLATRRAKAAVAEAEHFGDNDYRLGSSLFALGKILKERKLDAEAEKTLNRSFDVFEKSNQGADDIELRLNHEEQARVLETLGELYAGQQKLNEAKAAFIRAEGLFKNLCVVRDGAVQDSLVAHQFIRCLCGLAQVNVKLKDLAAAETCYQQALSLVDPADYSDLLAVHISDSLSSILKLQGREFEASRVQADHEWSTLVYAGQDAKQSGDLAKAEDLLRKSYTEAQKSGSTVRIVKSLELLSEVLIARGSDPISTLRKAVDQYDAHPDKKANYIDLVYRALAETYINLGRAPEAQPILLKWYEYRRSIYGDDSPQVADVLITTCNARQRCGMYADAKVLAEKVYKIVYPAHCSSKAGGSIAVKCATALVILGEPQKAAEVYKEVLKYSSRRRGDDHEQMLSLRLSLGAALISCDKKDEGREQFSTLARSLGTLETSPKLVKLLPYTLMAGNVCLANGFDPEAMVFYKLVKRTFAAYPGSKNTLTAPVLAQWNTWAQVLQKRTGQTI